MPLVVDKTVPVLTFKIGHYPMHHGTLGIIRSLGRLGVPVYTTAEQRFVPAAMSRYLTGTFIWDTRGLDSHTLLAGLAGIGEKLARRTVLVPTDDVAAVFVAEHSSVLAKWFLFPRLPPELPRRLANKRELNSLCKSMAFPCPRAAFPTSLDDVYEFIAKAVFPVVVKAAESRRLPKGTRGTSIARTPQELLAIYRRAESPGCPNLFFQEYIPESCAEDWIFHGYRNARTGCFAAFTGKKLRSYPPFAGFTTLGVSTSNDALRRQTEGFLKAISYSGIMDIDYRLDKRDGQYKILDFNPRIGANFRMFEDGDGVDVVRALHLDLTGAGVRGLPGVRGRTFIVEPHDLLATFGYMRRDGLTVSSWRRSLKGQRQLAWFDRHDPVPFLGMCLHLLCRGVCRAAQSCRARIRRRPSDKASDRAQSACS
jgi:D-aspartate ligase